MYDKTFIYDAWSCRVGKGLLGAIERAQQFLHHFPNAYVWKCDIHKFFDSVDQKTLLQILARRIKDARNYALFEAIIWSFAVGKKIGGGLGIPIGNLTSQIFANIYLNEFDRFVKHELKCKRYLRYGDDFIMVEPDLQKLISFRAQSIHFLKETLKLRINPKSDKIFKARNGLKFLGVILWPDGRKLNKRNGTRVYEKLAPNNIGSYYGVMMYHAKVKNIREFNWHVAKKILEES